MSHKYKYSKEEYDKAFEKADTGATIIEEGDIVNHCYGTDYFILTPEYLNALQAGKALYIPINGGEYCMMIKYDKDKASKEPEETERAIPNELQVFTGYISKP